MLPDAGLVLLADGISGREGAAVASQLVVHAVHAHLHQQTWDASRPAARTAGQAASRLCVAIEVANRLLLEQRFAHHGSRRGGRGVTTLLALAFVAGEALVAHVGDLRCYRLREGRLARLTRDHTILEASRSHVSADELEDLRPLQGYALVRSLGGRAPRVEVDVERSRVLPGDVYLACTSGLVEKLGDADLEWILASWPDPREASDCLVRAAREAGARDDITAVVAAVPPAQPALDVDPWDLARETARRADAPATA